MQNNLLKSSIVIGAVLSVLGCGSGSSLSGGVEEEIVPEVSIILPDKVQAAIDGGPMLDLDIDEAQDLKDAITYMYSEESLAHDVYMNIYKMQAVNQLQNIATNSEVKHIDVVNQIAQKYDLNITKWPDTEKPYSVDDLDRYGSGEYPVGPVQEIYNLLYDKGIDSKQDALEVGCMVEVVDIDDLNKFMEYASALDDTNTSDIWIVFDFLRTGSYAHYWAFDKGLKDMNIVDGCCSEDITERLDGHDWCHPEYPKE